MIITRLSLCAAAALLCACASQPPLTGPAPVTNIDTSAVEPLAPNSLHGNERRTRILAHHATWRGTPHQLGGLSRSGVDCSAYMVHTYHDVFALTLPRTTLAQLQLGHGVSRSQLRDGDLIFFKIGPDQRHVGIYIGNGQFAHASPAKGVTISSLDNVYWQRHYWQSRRVL